MITLMKREIEDHVVYFLAAVILSIIVIALLVSAVYRGDPDEPPVFAVGLSLPAIIVLIIGFCAMGATQMYTDKNRKISAFLSTLTVNRVQILVARVITGILAILTVLVPLVITVLILLQFFAPLAPIYHSLVFEIFTVIFLIGFAFYCIGLQTGWNLSKLTPTLGGLALTCILASLILVKGFGLHTIVILVLFIATSLIRTWQKFMSTPL